MKKLVWIFLFLLTSSLGFAQDLLKDKLLEVFSVEKTNLILKDVQLKKYYTNLVFNSFTVKKISSPKLKKQNIQTINSFELKNKEGSFTTLTPKQLVESVENGTFNILKLKIERDYSKSNLFMIGNTGYSLTVISQQVLSKLQTQ